MTKTSKKEAPARAEASKKSNEIVAQNSSIVMPVVNAQEAVAAWKKYIELKESIVDKDNDIQLIEGKPFLKKSYWRKVATFFNLTVEVVSEEREEILGDLAWHFTCKATAPNGRSAIGAGSCSMYEKATLINGRYMTKGEVTKWGTTTNGKSYPMEFKWKPAAPNSIHNVRSTAETRAWNRAVSNLVGGGEVSAEEVNQADNAYAPQPKATPESTSTSNSSACPECRATGKYHAPNCSKNVRVASSV